MSNATPKIGPTGRDLPGVDYEDGSEFDPDSNLEDGGYDAATDEEIEGLQLEKQRAAKLSTSEPKKAKATTSEPKRAKKTKATPIVEFAAAAPEAPDPTNGHSAPHAPLNAEDVLETQVTRLFPPAGWKAPCQTGEVDWIDTHDVREISRFVTEAAGGGKYRLAFFKNKKPSGSIEISIAGDPLPLREEDDGDERAPYAFHRPMTGYDHTGRPVFGSPDQPVVHPAGYPPQASAPAGGGFNYNFNTRAEQELKDQLREAHDRLEEISEKSRDDKWATQINELKLLVTAKQTPAGPNPMDSYMQLMQQQLAADRLRAEREEKDRVTKSEREDRERKEREEREEKRYQREREERAAREEREERRREEERKDRAAREERIAQEQRDFMKMSMAQNNPEKFIAMLSTLQGLTKADKDPVEQVTRLLEVQAALKDAIGDNDKDDEEETTASKVISGIAGLAKGAGVYLENAKANAAQAPAEQAQAQAQAPKSLPGPQAPPEESDEKKMGRLVLLIHLATDAYKTGSAPDSAATALHGYARRLHDEGHVGVVNEVAMLRQLSAVDAAELGGQLALLQAGLTNQTHAGYVQDLRTILETEKGAAWVKKTLGSL